MKSGENTIIKSIADRNFEIALVESPSGKYFILYSIDDEVSQSEAITDYNTATFLFDSKLQELEGH